MNYLLGKLTLCKSFHFLCILLFVKPHNYMCNQICNSSTKHHVIANPCSLRFHPAQSIQVYSAFFKTYEVIKSIRYLETLGFGNKCAKIQQMSWDSSNERNTMQHKLNFTWENTFYQVVPFRVLVQITCLNKEFHSPITQVNLVSLVKY